MASSASGPPCFCPLSQGRFIAAFFPSVGALHPALSFVVPTPSLHLTLSYPALASPMQLDHYSSEMLTHGLHRKILHISYLVLISPPLGPLHGSITHSGVICCPNTPSASHHLTLSSGFDPHIDRCFLLGPSIQFYPLSSRRMF